MATETKGSAYDPPRSLLQPEVRRSHVGRAASVTDMRVVLLGGAPGVGKTAVARWLLLIAARGPTLVQWVDVDALWRHQPWEVNDRTKKMVESNLRAVLANALDAEIDLVVVTWVFQSAEMHDLVRQLAPPGVAVQTIQLIASEATWRARFEGDPNRPPIDAFFESRYAAAQVTPVDHRICTDDLDAASIATTLAATLRL